MQNIRGPGYSTGQAGLGQTMQNMRGPGYSTRLGSRFGVNHVEYEGSGIFYPNFLRAHKPVRQYWGKPCRI